MKIERFRGERTKYETQPENPLFFTFIPYFAVSHTVIKQQFLLAEEAKKPSAM